MKTLRSVCKNEEAILVNLGIVPSCGPIIKKSTFTKIRVAFNNAYRTIFGLPKRSSAMQCMQITISAASRQC